MRQLLFRDWAVFFQIVGRIELLFFERLLPDDGVEEIPAVGHAGARGVGAVAERVQEGVAALVNGDVEPARHQHFRAVVQPEWLPVFRRESETRHSPVYALGIDAQRELQVFVDFTQHLSGVDDLHGSLFQPEIVAQRQDATGVDTGHRRAAEVHRNPVWLPMVQGTEYALSAGGFRHVLRTSMLTVSRRGDIRWISPKPTARQIVAGG